MEANRVNDKTRNMVVGLFTSRENAEKAYDDLKDRNYTSDEITVVMTNETRERHFAGDTDHDNDNDTNTEMGNKAMEGAGTGGAIGGVAGGIIGAIAAVGTSLLIPGLGIVILGPLAAGLAGAGAGSITGGLIGALVGSGMSKEKAELYDEGLKEGKIMISVKPHSQQEAVELVNKWREYQAEDIYS